MMQAKQRRRPRRRYNRFRNYLRRLRRQIAAIRFLTPEDVMGSPDYVEYDLREEA